MSLPVVYLLTVPAFYVAADKLGMPEKPLEVCCAPYEWLEETALMEKPLQSYWMLWMRIGYGDLRFYK